MVKKRATLPKDFEALLEEGNLNKLKAVFDTCDVNARGSFSKQTALAWSECPDDLTRWLVAQGADLAAGDRFEEPPLTTRSGHWMGGVDILIELGADLHHGEGGEGTALHAAASNHHIKNAAALLRAGARVNALDEDGLTALGCALQACENADISDMAKLAELLLAAGARKTPQMKLDLARLGQSFEFHRANFDPDSVDETDAALRLLYKLFELTPVAARRTHDGIEPIVAKAKTWQARHQELWEWLVPSSGAANTVQGEVIRLSGKIHRELEANGGVNWGASFKAMADAALAHFSAGTPLAAPLLVEAGELIAAIKRKQGNTHRLSELAVQWVALNPRPIKLKPPTLKR